MDLHYKQEATVGALVLVGALLFIGGTMWLGGRRLSTRPTVAVQFADAGTLKRGSPVRVSGVQLGMVDEIEFQGYGKVLVHLDLEEAASPRRDASAELATVGLVADAVINFNPGTAPQPLAEDAVIIGTVAPGFMDIGTKLGDQASSVLGGVNEIRFKEVSEDLQRSLRAFERLAGVYSNTVTGPIAQLTTTMQGLRTVSARIDSVLVAAQLDRTSRTADSLMANLGRLSASAQSTASQLDSVLARVNRGEGSLGKFTADTALYENTQRLVKSLQEFVDELKKNPGKLGLTVRIF
ncbi:MAG TPA: MlaD family protein [Gemmatimonadales bacterium]|nr:MlaD family protein [Gemmatimonadales bacterium]